MPVKQLLALEPRIIRLGTAVDPDNLFVSQCRLNNFVDKNHSLTARGLGLLNVANSIGFLDHSHETDDGLAVMLKAQKHQLRVLLESALMKHKLIKGTFQEEKFLMDSHVAIRTSEEKFKKAKNEAKQRAVSYNNFREFKPYVPTTNEVASFKQEFVYERKIDEGSFSGFKMHTEKLQQSEEGEDAVKIDVPGNRPVWVKKNSIKLSKCPTCGNKLILRKIDEIDNNYVDFALIRCERLITADPFELCGYRYIVQSDGTFRN